jgi:hypothetical protein
MSSSMRIDTDWAQDAVAERRFRSEPYRRQLRPTDMRAIEVIDSELRLLAVIRAVMRQDGGGRPSVERANELLDERLAADHASSE